MFSIIQIYDWPMAVAEVLVAESELEGFRFVRRAQEEWLSGANRFSKEGEAFFGVFEAERLLAIGGVNRQSEICGRLRRFYVLGEERRKGIGRQLVQHVITFSRSHYSCVSLRCDTAGADRFYRALGFTRSAVDSDITHSIDLKKEPNQAPEPTAPSGRGSS